MKKITCIVLALVLALGMATTAFAIADPDPVPGSPASHYYFPSAPVHIIGGEEENPDTGADVSASIIGGLVILGAAAAFAISKKKK